MSAHNPSVADNRRVAAYIKSVLVELRPHVSPRAPLDQIAADWSAELGNRPDAAIRKAVILRLGMPHHGRASRKLVGNFVQRGPLMDRSAF